MSSLADVLRVGTRRMPNERPSVSSVRFDWTASVLSVLVTCGIYLDGWAHNHGKVDQSFSTPWHAALYGGVFVTTAFLLLNQERGMSKGVSWQHALPAGYGLSLAGALVFRPAASAWRLPLFASAVPAIFYSLYFLALQLTAGLGWSAPLWLGSIVLAGITGLLLAFLTPQLSMAGPRRGS